MEKSTNLLNKKNGAICIIKQDLRRAICSIRFFLGVLLFLLWMIANIIHEVPSLEMAKSIGGLYLFNMAVDGTLYIGPVVLAIAAFPFSSCYLAERECGFQQLVVERVGISSYATSKSLATAVSAFIMALTGMAIFLGLVCAMHIPHLVQFKSAKGFYTELAYTRGPIWYYGIKAITTGLVCGFSAEFALMVSCWISNVFVCFLSPLIGYYFICCILELLVPLNRTSVIWQLFSPIALFFGQVAIGSNLFSFLWAVMLLSTLTFLCGKTAVWKLGKEQLM